MKFVKAAAHNGLMILVAGPNVLRFAPALNITSEEIQQGFDKLLCTVQNFELK